MSKHGLGREWETRAPRIGGPHLLGAIFMIVLLLSCCLACAVSGAAGGM